MSARDECCTKKEAWTRAWFFPPILCAFLWCVGAELPVAGSIKARGGIYEVLWYAQQVAEKEGLAFPGADGEPVTPAQLEALRTLCSQYRLSVGSTGNLGLSIGLVGAALGFQVTVHMSVDAKQVRSFPSLDPCTSPTTTVPISPLLLSDPSTVLRCCFVSPTCLFSHLLLPFLPIPLSHATRCCLCVGSFHVLLLFRHS